MDDGTFTNPPIHSTYVPSTQMAKLMRAFSFIISLALALLWTNLASAQWTMHRGDAARSGSSAEPLPPELKPAWTYAARHAPQPAWPREQRAPFDRAFHVVANDGTVYFGSSTEGTITALDASTGEVRWSFSTEGPVRFAPAVWKDKVFAVSDDGHLYCLAAADGKLIQKWRGGPSSEKVLGNQRIVSRWPARGGPVIFEGTLYYAAGVWQSEGVYLYAINADSGKTIWVNDSSGGIAMPQPHGGAHAESGVTAQGYLLANANHLVVPTGRGVPAVFYRADGKFLFYHLQVNRRVGGTEALLSGPEIFNLSAGGSGAIFDAFSGKALSSLPDGAYANTPNGVLHADGKSLRFLRRIEKETFDRRGSLITQVHYAVDQQTELQSVGNVPGGVSLLVAGSVAISGGPQQLTAVDLDTQQVLWSEPVDGIPYGLAAAEGKLFVSTDLGEIHCYATSGKQHRRVSPPEVEAAPYPKNEKWAAAASKILQESQISEGYCVDLACGNGALAYELAHNTDLQIVAVDADPTNVALARERLTAAGLYGSRVTVLLADPAASNLPKYIANLVVSSQSVTGESDQGITAEAHRLQRPYGGVVCLGPVEQLRVERREALPNAGTWTHQYSDVGNTGCTLDEVKGPLRALWYRDVDLELPQRHGRGPAPLFDSGRMFVMGMNELVAVDAYNGTVLWRFEVPGALAAYNADHLMGTAGTGSNFCTHAGSLYVRQGSTCHRLDAATGKVLGKFTAPQHTDGKEAEWGYIACQDGILYGSAVNTEHVVKPSWRPADMSQLFTESKFLFAMDANSGKLLWRYDAKDSIRNNAIAIGHDQVYLIDRALAAGDVLSARCPPRQVRDRGPHRSATWSRS